jgi:antitoxin YefM
MRDRTMNTLNINEAQANLPGLLEEAAASHEPILITSQQANAVLISEEDWRALQETLYLLSVPGMRESVREGLETPVEECATKLDW